MIGRSWVQHDFVGARIHPLDKRHAGGLARAYVSELYSYAE